MTLFSAILMDPPWKESGGGRRGAQMHYPLLSTRDIPRVVMHSGKWNIAPDAHLWMWSTNTFLPDALWVMSQVGFRYVTNFAWIKERNEKLQAGLGQYARGAHELLLFGVRGHGIDARTDRRDILSVIDEPSCYFAERGRHSAKPHMFHELVESRSRGPYVEFFARSQREGWTSFGNDPAVAQ
jgi:N6-adenosine-specific RNA methylase IME4